jgi:hypothetical protein
MIHYISLGMIIAAEGLVGVPIHKSSPLAVHKHYTTQHDIWKPDDDDSCLLLLLLLFLMGTRDEICLFLDEIVNDGIQQDSTDTDTASNQLDGA